MLIGRSAEETRLATLLADAREGRSGVLVLRGEAGIGKTALLERAAEFAEDFCVLRAIGVESEAEIAFAGLQQLLGPVVHALTKLPTHQARALRTALGIEDGPRPDRLVVSVATLTLLAAAAEKRPLLCVVDDVHWLDDASARTLVFAARRLQAEGVALLVAAREPEQAVFSGHGLPELRVQGLSATGARALLAQRSPDLAERTVDELLGLARGNPLALLELPRLLPQAQREGRTLLAHAPPVGAEVERVFLQRAGELSPEARRALLLVASGDPGDANAIWGALEAQGLDREALDEARRAGLLVSERVEFSHPLARSAAYQLARPADRRTAHVALAKATTAPDRSAWHLAAAADGPDERAATALEAAADQARRRGGVAGEAKALERAADLTADAKVRARRLLKAALAAEAAGWLEHAARMLEEVIAGADDTKLRAQAVARLTYILADRGDFDAASTLALRESERAAPAEAAHVLSGGAIMALCHSLDIRSALATAERAWELAGDGAPTDLDLCEMLARACLLAGRTEAAEGLARSGLESADPGSILAIDFATDLLYLEDYATAQRALECVVELSRTSEAPGILAYALDQLAKLETRAGSLTRAYSLELECLQLTEALGNDVALAASLAWLGSVEAVLGRPEARDHAERSLGIAEHARDEFNVVRARAALGLEALTRGEATAAAEWLRPAVMKVADGGVKLPNFFRLEGDLVEALVRLGDVDDALAHLRRLEEGADRTGSTWAHAVSARCKALVAAEDEAAALFEAAARLHDCDPSAFESARTALCYGEWLRRTGRRRDARGPLRAALETFDRIEARPWAERARTELRATGERVRRRDPTAAERLTPQEYRIATLVAEGLTNRDVAARLFLSPKTIEFHLSGVFRKLHVRSRGELIRLFAAQSEQAPTGTSALTEA